MACKRNKSLTIVNDAPEPPHKQPPDEAGVRISVVVLLVSGVAVNPPAIDHMLFLEYLLVSLTIRAGDEAESLGNS